MKSAIEISNNNSNNQNIPNENSNTNVLDGGVLGDDRADGNIEISKIYRWLEESEEVNPEEISRYTNHEREELISKLKIVYNRIEDWKILKGSQFKIQDLFRLEKHKISLLLNHAEYIAYLQLKEGLNYSVESIIKSAHEQNLLILLKYTKKMSLLKDIQWTSKVKDLFDQDRRTLDSLLSLGDETFLLLGRGISIGHLTSKERKISDDHEREITSILGKQNVTGNLACLERQGFIGDDFYYMTPARLKLLFECIDQIHYLKKLGYANHTIMNEPDEGIIRLLLIKGEAAIEIAYEYPLTQNLIENLGRERIELMLDKVEGTKTLFECGFFKLKSLEGMSLEKLKVLLDNHKKVRGLVKAGFRVEIMLDPEVSLERLEFLLANNEKVSYLLRLKISSEENISKTFIQDESLVSLSLEESRLDLILRNPQILESYIQIDPEYMKQGIFYRYLIDDSTLGLLLDEENHIKIVNLVHKGFDFKNIISLHNQKTTELMISRYRDVIRLIAEGFNVNLLEKARKIDKLNTLLINAKTVFYLREQGYSAEEIVSIRLEVLNLILPKPKNLEGLCIYGFDKKYLLADENNARLLDLLLANYKNLLVLKKLNINNLAELTSLYQEEGYFYQNMTWLFENYYWLGENNRNILNMLSQGYEDPKAIDDNNKSYNLQSILTSLYQEEDYYYQNMTWLFKSYYGFKANNRNILNMLSQGYEDPKAIDDDSKSYNLQSIVGALGAQNRNRFNIILNKFNNFALLERNGFNLEDFHKAKGSNKLLLLVNNARSVVFLLEQGFSVEEIISMKLEILNFLSRKTELKTLFAYGFRKDYFINPEVNIKLLDLLITNAGVLNRLKTPPSHSSMLERFATQGFNKDYLVDSTIDSRLVRLFMPKAKVLNRFKTGLSHLAIDNLAELANSHQQQTYFYENMSWLFENYHLLTENNRNILNMLGQGLDAYNNDNIRKGFSLQTIIGVISADQSDENKEVIINTFASLEREGFSLEDLHLAQEGNSFSLLFNNVNEVSVLIVKGFVPKEIALLRKEVLESLLNNLKSVDVLMGYGFKKEYFIDNNIKTDFLDFVLAHSEAFLLFNGEDYKKKNPYGIKLKGLVELVSEYSSEVEADQQANLNNLKKLLERAEEVIKTFQINGLKEVSIRSENLGALSEVDESRMITDKGTEKLSLREIDSNNYKKKNIARLATGGGAATILGGIGGFVLWGVMSLIFKKPLIDPIAAISAGGAIGVGATAVYSQDENRRYKLEKSIVIAEREVQRNIPTSFDKAFRKLFRMNNRNELIFSPEFQVIKDFIKDTMGESILKTIKNFRKLSLGKSLTIKVLINGVEDDEFDINDWNKIGEKIDKSALITDSSIQNKNLQPYIQSLARFQRARIIFEQDLGFNKLERVPQVMLQIDGPSQEIVRHFALLLGKENVQYVISKVEECKGEDISSIDIPEMRAKMDRNADQLEWNMG